MTPMGFGANIDGAHTQRLENGNRFSDIEDDMTGPSREEIDAKLRTVSAETDTKLARMDGKLDLLLSKISDLREDGRSTRNTVWGATFAVLALVVALAAFAPVVFDLGTKQRDIIRDEVKSAITQPK